MPNFFPPDPAYPLGLDTDYSLYLVHNSAEAPLAEDNEPWAEEVEVVPVGPDDPDVWPGNGFATIGGELFYYDGVDLNDDGKVYRLRRCARGLGGSASRINRVGPCTTVRGFVVAEHHNQLVGAILAVEDFVGINFDDRTETLDYRIRNLRETPVIFDDWSCPDVTFNFVTLENDPAGGVVISYLIQILGSFTSYRLDFGDGTFTTSDQSGTHTYAYSALVSPVVTVSNNQCTIIQSPITRTNPDVPGDGPEEDPFHILIPEPPPIPPFVPPPPCTTEPEIVIPPFVQPCPEAVPSIPNIPIIPNISIGPIFVPSFVSISPIDIPSLVSFSPVDIPSIVSFGPLPTISPIGFGPVPTIAPIDINIDINIDASDIPSCISLGCEGTSIAVDWGVPPTLNVAFVSGLNAQAVRRPNFDPDLAKELGEDYMALFEGDDGWGNAQVAYESVGIPSEIRIVPPEFPAIKVVHGLPEEIRLVGHDLPAEIPVVFPANFPAEIRVSHDLPSGISIVGVSIPSTIKVEHDIPTVIALRMIDPIPSSIVIDASGIPESIQVVGFPSSIELRGPESIKLVLDENVEVPLVYRQGPIDLRVELDMTKLLGGEDGENCVMIVPCRKN